MSSQLIDRTAAIERAGCAIPWTQLSDRPSDMREQETAGLVAALGCELSFVAPMQVRNPSPSHLLSGGLQAALAERLAEHECSICVIDGALTPVQQRNLERALQVKVIDRTGLILEIFGLRARTREGQLQVELARLNYERSRLVRTWTHLERQRGGKGFLSGPGETQLEADRRMLDTAVRRLKEDLEDVRRTRGLQRAGRAKAGTPVISLVGYTNSGKSTLFNRLSGASVFAKDMPFATLDPTIRRMTLPTLGEAALVDTVGFITDLPTHLIDSFQATLEEITESDLLIHVRDRASSADEDQRADVMTVLKRLETESGHELPPLIEVWNKADAMNEERRNALQLAATTAQDPQAVVTSALTGDGAADLIALIENILLAQARLFSVRLQPENGDARAWLFSHGDVVDEIIGEDAVSDVSVRLTQVAFGQFQARFPQLSLAVSPNFTDVQSAS